MRDEPKQDLYWKLVCLLLLSSGTPKFPVCEDRHKYCSYWAYAGECKKSSAYMLVNCKYSCNICGGKCCHMYAKISGPCSVKRFLHKLNVMSLFDLYFLSEGNVAECQDQDEKCSSLARKGDCLKNAAYMLVKCRKSCFMCGGRKSRLRKINDLINWKLSTMLQPSFHYTVK